MSELKNDCHIIQDLMPLVIDEACSEESRKCVEEHIASCPECAQIYESMKAAVPAPVFDAEADRNVKKAMKKARKKYRWVRIVAVCLGVIVLLTSVFVLTNPSVLYYPQTTAPASWFMNAHLLRTQDGILLMRFIPAARMRNFYGVATFSISGEQINTQGETVAPGSAKMEFQYPWIARLFSSADAVQAENRWNDLIFRLSGGDWVLPFAGGYNFRYADGAMREAGWRPLTAEEVKEQVAKGVSVTGRSMIFDFIDTYGFKVEKNDEAVHEERRQITMDALALRIAGGGQEVTVHQPGDAISLCDEETEIEFQRWKQSSYHAHLFPEIGTVIPETP